MRRARRYAQIAAAWFLLYVAIAGTLGLIMAGHYTSEPSCSPFNSADGVIATFCQNQLLNVLWALVAGLPRLFLLIPTFVIGLLAHAVMNGDIRGAMNSAPFLVVTAPLMFVFWVGTRYWLSTRKIVGIAGATLILADIMWLVWHM